MIKYFGTFYNPLWQSLDGSIRNFRAMTDEHLANIVLHLKHYSLHNSRAFSFVEREIKIRNLSEDFLSKAPYPYKDPRTGEWYIWSFESDTIVPVCKDTKENK